MVKRLTLDNLRVRGDAADVYSFDATEGSVIDIRTSTPLGGPGEPVNAFDPVLEVVNAAGFLVASDDNSGGDGRNARTTFTVPAGGAGSYIVRVKAQNNTTGEYTLSIVGASQGLGPAPTVTSTTPLNGERFLAPPTTITLRFSEALRLDSIAASDLTIDGGATVTGVEIVNATTVRYTISVPNLETVYTYSFARWRGHRPPRPRIDCVFRFVCRRQDRTARRQSGASPSSFDSVQQNRIRFR